MEDAEFNRDDPALAEEIMRDLCRNKAQLKILLSQLVNSSTIAQRVAPRSVGVSLFNNGFRLNVGQAEAFSFLSGNVIFRLLGLPVDLQSHANIKASHLRSVPQPQHLFSGSVSAFSKLAPLLIPSHTHFLQAAAVTSSGKPRSSPFGASNSPGLVAYAYQAAGDAVEA